jgi:spore maturation protein CgeB
MNLKILVIGSTKKNSLENFIFRHFPDSDEILFYGSENLSLGKFSRILLRIGCNSVLNPFNKSILNYVNDKHYDVIFVFKGFGIMEKTIIELKKNCSLIVNFNPDHPFIRYKLSHGGSYILKSLNHFDVYMSYDKKVVHEINENHSCKAFFMPFGYDIEEIEYDQIKKNELREINEVCFVGDGDFKRFLILSYLAFNGIKINVYGNNWKKWYGCFNKNIKFKNSIDRDSLYKIIKLYRVQLNLLRKHNLNSFNMRTFEIPSVGGIQLMTYTDVISEYFDIGDEIFVFKNRKELKNNILNLLSIDIKTSLKIRANSRRRSLINDNSYNFISNEIRKILLQEIKVKDINNV